MSEANEVDGVVMCHDNDLEKAKAINDAIMHGTGFLFITAKDVGNGIEIKFKRLNADNVLVDVSAFIDT